MRRLPPEHGRLHALFEASLLAKGLFALVETLSGLALFATPTGTLQRALDWLTRSELIEDLSDPLARRVAEAFSHFDQGSQHFLAVYLLGHGALKLAVVGLLARRVAAAYPLAIVVFAGFIAYQLHRWQNTGSPAMLVLSALDVAVIALTWNEWRMARRMTTRAT